MASESLFEVLEHRGIKVRWLAQQVGVSESFLSMAKKGQRHISAQTKTRIARVLGLPESILFFDRTSRASEKVSLVNDSAEPPQSAQEGQESPSELPQVS